MSLSDIERLTIIEDIKKMRAGFARFLDTKDWESFESLWAPDAVMDVSEEGAAEAIVTGPAAITAFVRHAIGHATTVHHAHAPEIEVLTSSYARGIWAMEDRLRWPEGSPLTELNGFGHYHETYERCGGPWVVKSFRLTRLRVELR